MGMGMMPPTFDEKLLGMNVGDEKTFDLVLPGAPEDEAPIQCTVGVLELQKKEVPELNDQFVANFFPMMKGIDALRGAIEDSMRMQIEQQRHQMAVQQATQQILDALQGEDLRRRVRVHARHAHAAGPYAGCSAGHGLRQVRWSPKAASSSSA